MSSAPTLDQYLSLDTNFDLLSFRWAISLMPSYLTYRTASKQHVFKEILIIFEG
jgi:hypothetical protein